MKKLLLLLLTVLSAQFGHTQTASNFTCNDCAGSNHDLFTELNSGKIIVIAWVMPCAAWISGELAGYSAVQSFPGQAYFYLADDFANSSCATITSWANNNGMTSCNAIFSNTAVSMTPYGTAGMPKVVVLGGSNHTVYYNQNDASITQSGIQNAISAAVSANGIKENSEFFSGLKVYPNPTNHSSNLTLSL